MASAIAEPPITTPITATGAFLSQTWADWIVLQLMLRVQQVAQVKATPATLTGQTTSLGVTAFKIGTINAGTYRVNWTARVTTPASSSSSLQVVVSYTRSGVSCTQTSTALTSNATNAPGSGFFELNSDGGAPISYSTVYSSTGGVSMIYELDASIEQTS